MNGNKTICLNGKILDLSYPVVMAIVNITPDSFFPGSRNLSEDDIRRRVATAIDGGASIIDVGGYSSRPGADEVSAEEEYKRVITAVRIIREISPSIPVSIDTFRASVAEKVINETGGCIVNDISAGELDPDMISVVASLGVPYIAMHMRGTPETMQDKCDYEDVVAEVVEYFSRRLDVLQRAGVKDVILDPGFGFAKTVEQNYELLAKMECLGIFGKPILAGISRKTMIWKPLGITPDQALNGTTALNWECLRQGASILRVHDVKEAAETVRLYNIYNKERCQTVL